MFLFTIVLALFSIDLNAENIKQENLGQIKYFERKIKISVSDLDQCKSKWSQRVTSFLSYTGYAGECYFRVLNAGDSSYFHNYQSKIASSDIFVNGVKVTNIFWISSNHFNIYSYSYDTSVKVPFELVRPEYERMINNLPKGEIQIHTYDAISLKNDPAISYEYESEPGIYVERRLNIDPSISQLCSTVWIEELYGANHRRGFCKIPFIKNPKIQTMRGLFKSKEIALGSQKLSLNFEAQQDIKFTLDQRYNNSPLPPYSDIKPQIDLFLKELIAQTDFNIGLIVQESEVTQNDNVIGIPKVIRVDYKLNINDYLGAAEIEAQNGYTYFDSYFKNIDFKVQRYLSPEEEFYIEGKHSGKSVIINFYPLGDSKGLELYIDNLMTTSVDKIKPYLKKALEWIPSKMSDYFLVVE